MELIKKQIENKTEMYLSDVPNLSPKIVEILEFQGFKLKVKPLENGLNKVWFGSYLIKDYDLGNKIDSYNLLKIQILSMIDNLNEGVWNKEEGVYMDTFEMVEPYVPIHNKLFKKAEYLKKIGKIK